MELRLVKPDIFYKQSIIKFKEAFTNNKESGIEGTSWLMDYQSIEEWLEFLKLLENESMAPDNLVPALQYLFVDENDQVIGMINLRLSLNEWLSQYGGHVGYSVLPFARGMGFGTKQLELLLPIAREKNLKKLLITCLEDNIASRKIIEANGGKYESNVTDQTNGKRIRRYWISLDEAGENV